MGLKSKLDVTMYLPEYKLSTCLCSILLTSCLGFNELRLLNLIELIGSSFCEVMSK